MPVLKGECGGCKAVYTSRGWPICDSCKKRRPSLSVCTGCDRVIKLPLGMAMCRLCTENPIPPPVVALCSLRGVDSALAEFMPYVLAPIIMGYLDEERPEEISLEELAINMPSYFQK